MLDGVAVAEGVCDAVGVVDGVEVVASALVRKGKGVLEAV